MDPAVQEPWGLTQTSGTGRGVVEGDPEVKRALSLAQGTWGEWGPAVPMAQGILGGSVLQMGPVLVMAQGRQEKWGPLVVLALVSPQGHLEEQSLGKPPGRAHRCLETKAVTVLQDGGLADSLVSRPGQEAPVEGPWVKPEHSRRLGTHPEAGAMLALGESIAPMVA